jgi:flagellar motor component MotA
MKCTPEIEDRIRGIIRKGLLAVIICFFGAGIMYVTYINPMVFVVIVGGSAFAFGIIGAAWWISGEGSFCKRPSKYEEDDEYEDML